jgi:hypothetical protein
LRELGPFGIGRCAILSDRDFDFREESGETFVLKNSYSNSLEWNLIQRDTNISRESYSFRENIISANDGYFLHWTLIMI